MKEKLKNTIEKVLHDMPYLKQVLFDISKVGLYKTWVPPGHFYSPIPSLAEVKDKEQKIFDKQFTKILPGIDLNEEVQLALLEEFSKYYPSLPFSPQKTAGLRYFYENSLYSYSDAICLYCMINYLKPNRIIEVGSGYSSCLILDVNELIFSNTISCSFIEPYLQRLQSLIKASDKDQVEIIQEKLQNVESSKFQELSAGDILFIDSTHVSKIDSDVNYIFFEILPVLKKGVYIHFHDIFYPFEYPKEWIFEGRAWNEAYMLRAFLQHNQEFKIVFFNTFLELFYKAKLIEKMPLCMKNRGGSIWLKKN